MEVDTLTMQTVNKTALEMLLKMFRRELEGSIQTTGRMAMATLQREQCPPVQERCDEKPLWNALMGYGFLVVFCLALVGNCLNLLVYNSDHIRFFIAIRMLCTKLSMNTLMMVVMLPQALRVIRLWDVGGPTDQLYWRFWPYQAYLTNVFGFCAMWLTVLMTAECYIHIFFPSKSKQLCTKKTVWRSYLVVLSVGLVLASIYPLNRNVSLSKKCDRVIVKIITSQHALMQMLEKVHTLADMFLSILVPLSMLVFMTARIVWRLWVWPSQQCRRLAANNAYNTQKTALLSANPIKLIPPKSPILGKHFAAEKRGVTRITLITCFIQLVTETPSMSVLIYVSMFGPNVHKQEYICAWQTISYFLCLCNASLSFFVYITFSTRFRLTMISRFQQILHRLCPSVFTESALAIGSSRGSQHHQQMNNSSTSQMLLANSPCNRASQSSHSIN